MDGLADIFIDIEQAHKKAIKHLQDGSRNKKSDVVTVSFSTLKKNGKHALVFLSPDTKFSSGINRRVFEEFAKALEQNGAEPIIVGNVGKRFFDQRFPEKQRELFHIPQALNNLGDIKELITKLVQYERIDVFYSRFYSLVKQEPVLTNVTGNISLSKQKQSERIQRDFLFEPELKTMLHFFELQIFTSLLQQTVNESYLANLGARIVTLETAVQNIKEQSKNLRQSYLKVSRREKSRKQRAQIAGLSLWN